MKPPRTDHADAPEPWQRDEEAPAPDLGLAWLLGGLSVCAFGLLLIWGLA